jgi:hypothetical protein
MVAGVHIGATAIVLWTAATKVAEGSPELNREPSTVERRVAQRPDTSNVRNIVLPPSGQ